MQKSIKNKVNILVCFIIATGFLIVATIAYKTSERTFEDNIEHISALTTEAICSRLETIFAKPVNIALTVAASPFLKDVLLSEPDMVDDVYIKMVKEYLNAYKVKYDYNSIFLVSAKTSCYYTYNGIDRVLRKDNHEDEWFYSFLESDEDYSLNVDNDEAAHGEITIFVNCRIKGSNGETLGIAGVGLLVNDLQNILEKYSNEYGADIYMLNKDGDIEIAVDNNGYQPVNFFDICGYPQFKDEILGNNQAHKALAWWITEKNVRNHVMAQLVPELNWQLIVEHNTTLLSAQIEHQFFRTVFTALITCLLIIIAITYITNRYNKQVIILSTAIEREKQAAFREATEQLYDNIYELNITQNCAMGEHTHQYFESLGMVRDTPYDTALTVVAENGVKEEHKEGYISTFSTENVLREFEKGNTNLIYDLQTNVDSEGYYWLRIMAHIYYRKEDACVCMFTYRKNIDAEKRKEAELFAQAQLDGLTNVYNKTATKHQIKQMLSATKEDCFAFFIIDIDNFKQVNDSHGHAFGDLVITKFAAVIKRYFRNDDVIGRIGGDEFVVFLSVPGEDWMKQKVSQLSKSLDTEVVDGDTHCKISASIGVATTDKDGADFETLYKNADTALYATKRRGKNGYSIYKC